MPPFVGRKRLSTSPEPIQSPRNKRAKLGDALDQIPSLSKSKTFSLRSDSDSSLSDVDSDVFENVTEVRYAGPGGPSKGKAPVRGIDTNDDDDDDDDDDDEIEWEDASARVKTSGENPQREIKDVKITLRNDIEADYDAVRRAAGGKRGISRREKQARIDAHQMHVQFLMWHNAIRNSWIQDKQLQDILVKQLPPQIVKEIEKWRKASGLVLPEKNREDGVKAKKNKNSGKNAQAQAQRDWGRPSQHLDPGKPDMSRGDPLIYLLKVLSAYWKKRFAVTAPGLRKRGYGAKFTLRQDIDSFRKEKHNPAKHGERILNLHEFRQLATKCEGSRDAGAQLFTALLRGIGIDSRMVASLQPVGYGWAKAEHMVPRKPVNGTEDDENSADDDSIQELTPKASKSKNKPTKPLSKRAKSSKPQHIVLDSDLEVDENAANRSSGDDSLVDITPSIPKAKPPKYDRDLAFPIYWTEAISPITSQVISVSPLVLESPVVITPSESNSFEPRGAKAEKTRQIMAYVIAHASDGTAKDVTVRYLRKKLWPGKTKGFRAAVEKVPVYDKHGRIERYGNRDWFKYLMMHYRRSDDQRTPVDDIEDSVDLVAAEPEKKAEVLDTLQGIKSSTEFVLERFLRREEALKPGSQPVRTFVSGKGENVKKEPVYSRADVERCLTAESWHKEGRQPIEGEIPMKLVPVRAVTLVRKREAEEHEARTGEKQMQGLYSWDQTEWIIPSPIINGIIPKNSYGNIDCFVPSMVPSGAVHVPLRGTVRLCKKLEIDFAEAVTGFEFGNKMAVPVITGVVVAEEHEHILRDAWKEWNEEQKRKEDKKLETLVLEKWKKFLIGLRIRHRLHNEYGVEDSTQMIDRGTTREKPIDLDADSPGGYLPEQQKDDFGGGFLLPEESGDMHVEELVMDNIQNSQQHTFQAEDNADSTTAQSPMPTHSESADSSHTTPTHRRQRTSPPFAQTSYGRGSAREHRDGPTSSALPLSPATNGVNQSRTHTISTSKSIPSDSVPPDHTRQSRRRKPKPSYLEEPISEDSSSPSEESTFESQAVDTASTRLKRKRPRKARKNNVNDTPKRPVRKTATQVTSPYFDHR